MDCDCIILSGGKSTRFGSDKLKVVIWGKTLIQHTIDRVSPHFKKTFVVGGKENPDILCAGPLGGVYTGLRLSQKRCFVIGGDMPLFNQKAAEILYSRKGEAVVPIHENGDIEPLYAFYEPSICRKQEIFINSGKRKIRDFLNEIRTTYVPVSDLRVCDPKLSCFLNLNTEKELSVFKGNIAHISAP